MAQIHETAYPRLKRAVTAAELARVYTPTPAQMRLARQVTKGPTARVGFLVLLMVFQRLGYFVLVADVSDMIIQHLADLAQAPISPRDLQTYDASGTRRRHLQIIRAHRQIQPYGRPARRALVRAMAVAAQTKEDLADLINIGIEELIRLRYELPVFRTLQRAARHIRALTHRGFYRQVSLRLTSQEHAQLEAILHTDEPSLRTPWHMLKQDPGSPTLTQLKAMLDRLAWLTQLPNVAPALAGIPDVKIKHFAEEAHTLDAARMLVLESRKRCTLIAALLTVQLARARDDLAEMFIKRMLALHQKAKESLEQYRTAHQARTDALVTTLRDVVLAYQLDQSRLDRIAALDDVLQSGADAILSDCEAHLAHAGRNYYPFLWAHYKSHRPTLFRIMQALTFHSTSQQTAFVEAMQFLQHHQQRTSDWLPVRQFITDEDGTHWVTLLDLSWVPEGWWRLLTDQHLPIPPPTQIRRRHFEVCVFTEMMAQLKSGDLALVGSDAYADYRDQLIDWSEYQQTVAAYGQMVGFPTDGDAFVAHMRQRLHDQAQATDTTFLRNEALRIERGEPILSRSTKQPEPPGLQFLETHLAEDARTGTILDILRTTEHWLNWTAPFGPISGHESKLKETTARYLATIFCYGCNLGPTQTARGLPGLDRKHLAWANQRHITEEALEQASRIVINGYQRMALIRRWGTGKRVSADGMKWDMYERNLLAEYHIRYGGYGGIGYYHVSDTYIALFSHFIPCGVWEAVYILDGLLKNESDIQPDTIHADTQGQSAPVFGLAFLLGIALMPRIRQWKHLTFFRPARTARYTHIDELFSAPIDWVLIKTHLPDMLRVALSIKAGRITASTILRRLSSYNRHNRLYQAFRELGRVVRTTFLLEYLADADLRAIIQAATNKSESFNQFVQWLAFGGEGVIAENDRAAQRKVIKYNHLVANCVIFHNVVEMSRILQALHQEGQVIDPDAVAALSPYITAHIDRFGRYSLDMNQPLPDLDEAVFRADWLPASKGQGREVPVHKGEHRTAAAEPAAIQLTLDEL